MHWLSENYKWLFDGFGGAAILAVIAGLLGHFRPSLRRKQRARLGAQGSQGTISPTRLVEGGQNTARPVWPQQLGVWIAASSGDIPDFPSVLSGYRSEENRDFWSKPFVARGSLRVFEGDDWQGIYKFPVTMNGCSHGVFMARWRSADSNVTVRSTARNSAKSKGDEETGAFGYMSGTNCEQPMFKCGEMRNGATLVDVFYELKFWQAAP